MMESGPGQPPERGTDAPEPQPGFEPSPPAASVGRRRGVRRMVGLVVIVAVVLGGGLAVYRQRHAFVDTLHKMGPGVAIGAFACGLIGVFATCPAWREVLRGFGVRFPWAEASRLYFTTQLGKYLPGSVWPIIMQMEAGRSRGASRRTMLAGNLVANLLNCTIGLIVGCALLPIYDADALERYWWALLGLPLLLVLLHPRTIPWVLDRIMARVHRPPLGERLNLQAEMRASGWSLVGWVGLGLQLTVMCAALGRGGFSTFVLCTGGMALAFSLGVLFIPAPAGAGIREVILTLALVSILTQGQAFAVVVASRVMLIASDVLLAGVSLLLRQLVPGGRWHRPSGALQPEARPRPSGPDLETRLDPRLRSALAASPGSVR
jgi:glycosyltransferase 2 family protein